MPEMTKEQAFKLGVRAAIKAVLKGTDPYYAEPMLVGEAEDVLMRGQDADAIAAALYERTPQKFRLDPAAVAARERERVQEDRRTYDQERGKGNSYDSIRQSVRDAEEKGKRTSAFKRAGTP